MGRAVSVVHRAPAGAKLLGLVVLTTGIVAFRSPMVLAAAAALVLGGYVLAKLRPARLWAVVRPLRWFVAFLVVFQWWTSGWQVMVVVVGTLVVAVVAAGLVTATTRTTDLLDAVVAALRPLRRFGVDPDRVGLAFSLAIRALPVIQHAFDEAQDARRARGQERSARALVTPVVVRTIRHAERTGEALAARGLDD